MSILLRLSTVFLLALSVFLSTVSARPQLDTVERVRKREGPGDYRTNAARMAAGLGPVMPRNLFNPTRVKVARQQPSAVVTSSGRIQITRANGGVFVGYVDKDHDSSGRLTVNTNANAPGSYLTVSFTQPASTTSRFNIQITSNGNPSQPNLGFALDTTTLQAFPNHYFTTLTGTNPTTAGGIAEQVGNGMSSSNPYSESPIWSYDVSTGILSNTWFNPSSPGSSTGSAVTVKTFYQASTGALVQGISDLTLLGFVQVVLTVV